uniref:Synaptobrevin, longin-like domain protein n=1 Tax=Tanacetum cinerariifolium TaxID=118510 RepID=A0A6L2KFI6_TANCI|nr:hypothetical protein [Tanacetum cinerariifolium]
MAALRYRDAYNKVGYLLKPTESDDYHQIIDFLRASNIRYALTHDPIIFDSLVKQLWSTATLRSPELGPSAIQATIDMTPYTITEDLVRSQLQFTDDGGIDDLPIMEIYSEIDNLGYVTEGKLTFFKNKFSPQWRFLVHTILHCLSTKSGMVSNIGNAKKFLMYPRFLQVILGIETRIKRQYKVLKFFSKLFANMRLKKVKHGQSSDLNIASFSRTHETHDDPFTNMEDEPLGGSFHMSPPRSTQVPPSGQTSGDAEDLITLTALSSVVSTLVHKDHKKKMVVSDSDQEEGGKQDVDLDALLALANAAVTVDSNISLGGASDNPAASTSVPADVPTRVNIPTGSTSVSTDVPTSVAPAGVSNKGKTLMVEEDITVKERTFKQMQEDRLGEQAAKRLHDEEQAQIDRQRAELQRRRQQEVLASAMYYTEADWINIMAQVEANASLSKTLLGDDVWSIARVKSFIDDQCKAKFEKIQKAISNIHIQAFSRTLKRTGPVLEEPSSKRQKYIEAPILSVPKVPQSPVVSSSKSFGTRKKSLGRNRLTKPKSKLQELDLDADDQTFIKVVSDEDSEDEASRLWSALVDWEYYENHPVAGAGVILWGDLQVLFDSHKKDVSYPLSVKLIERMLKHKLEIDKEVVGNDMTIAEQLIRFIKNQLAAAQFAQNYRVFNSHMLHLLRVEMVIDSPWIMLILRTKELASPEQMATDAAFSRDISLICADFSSILVKIQSSRYVVSTGEVVPTSMYVVPAGNVIIVSPGRIQIVIPG